MQKEQEDFHDHWRARRLRKSINARRNDKEDANREQSGAKKHARDAMSLRALQREKTNFSFLRKRMFEEEVENRAVLERASQHMVIDHLVHVLTEDICGLSRNSKENLDVLGNLESRVRKLRATNTHGSSNRPWADRQVDVDLMVDLSRPNALLLAECSVCSTRVLKSVLGTHERFCRGATDSPDEQPEDEEEAEGGTDPSKAGGVPAEIPRCAHCTRPFKQERLAKHEESCKKKNKAIGMRVVKEERARNTSAKMAPRPPRNLKVIGKTCDQVTLAWERPIIDGGAAVFEHEVSYSVHEVVRKDKYSKEDVVTPADPVLTSRWCLAKPIAATGFTLTGLRAGTHFVNLSVRCQNEVGWSDPSEAVEEVFTDDAVPPSPPLFFRVDVIRANRAVLRWKEPLFKGGGEVREYEVTYTDVLPKDNQAVTGKKMEIDRHHEIRTPTATEGEQEEADEARGGDQVLVLRGLRASTVHKGITIRALSESGMASSSVSVPDFTTLPPGRRQRITDELARARAATGGWIDTDFYRDFLQRENREDYIAKLKGDLASLPPKQAGDSDDDDDEDNASVQADEAEQGSRDRSCSSAIEKEKLRRQEEILESVFHGYKRRKAQFTYRLKRLREQIEECEETRLAHIGQRAVLAQQLMITQVRVMEIQAELERVANFKGEKLNSSVLHGSQQRFPIKVLRLKLRHELEAGQASIARDKGDLVEGRKTSLRAMQLKLKREDELKERLAAFAVFNRNSDRARKLSDKLQVNKQSDPAVMQKAFSALVLVTKSIQRERAVILNALLKMRLRLVRAAFHKWRTGKHITSESVGESKYIIRGIAGRLLLDAEDERERMEKEFQIVMRDAASLRRNFSRINLTNSQRASLEGSSVFQDTELGSFMEDSEAAGLDTALLAQGDGLMKIGQAPKAEMCYSRQIEVLGYQSDRMGLSTLGVSHSRLAKSQMACDRFDLAAVNYERVLELSSAAKHLPGMVDAQEGLGNCCLESCQYSEAIALFKRALACNVEVKDRPREARLYRSLEGAHRRMVDEEHAEVYAERAESIEKEMESKLVTAKASLEESATRLVGRTANSAKVVQLERVTAGYVAMCSRQVFLQENLQETIQKKKAQEKVVKVQEMKLGLIRDQIKEAQESDKDAMTSTLIVEGETMSFEIEELKSRLREREIDVTQELAMDAELLTALTNRATNAVDEMEALEQDIAIEGGPLMASVVSKTRLRLIALNTANTAGNEIEGTATGGVEKVVATEGKKVLVYGIAKGNLEHVFGGDEPGRHTGELLGHSGVITALFFYKKTAYTGSMDCTVQVWDLEEKKRSLVLHGHEATVCSVVADADKIVSGAADKEILIWNPIDGSVLRVLHGHTKSVVSLHSGASFILSGGADGDIRLWGAAKISKFGKASTGKGGRDTDDGGGEGGVGRYECKRRLSGHYRSATCVSYGRLELVSGHEDGTVVVWWASTGLIMLKSKVHVGPVRQLQFDATKVVSCGTDGVIAVTDLTTGECTMTLRGHEGKVLAVAFDRSKILSASDDGTLRTWVWATRGPKQDKYVVLGVGDNLGRIAKQHGVTVADVVKWNGVRDTRQLGVGVKLIVRKGNPNEPTAAEIEAAKTSAINERRTQTIVRSRAKTQVAEGSAAVPRRRKGMLAASDEPASLISRMGRRDVHFDEMWQEARRLEVVTAKVDSAGDRTMAGRVRQRIRAMAEEAAAFDSDSDREKNNNSNSNSDSTAEEDNDSGDDDYEQEYYKGSSRRGGGKNKDVAGVIAKQAREREQVVVDVTGALLGAVVASLTKGVVRDAVALSLPKTGILGRVNAYNAQASKYGVPSLPTDATDATEAAATEAAENAGDQTPQTRLPPILTASSPAPSTPTARAAPAAPAVVAAAATAEATVATTAAAAAAAAVVAAAATTAALSTTTAAPAPATTTASSTTAAAATPIPAAPTATPTSPAITAATAAPSTTTATTATTPAPAAAPAKEDDGQRE